MTKRKKQGKPPSRRCRPLAPAAGQPGRFLFWRAGEGPGQVVGGWPTAWLDRLVLGLFFPCPLQMPSLTDMICLVLA